jgi:hypothetical protein
MCRVWLTGSQDPSDYLLSDVELYTARCPGTHHTCIASFYDTCMLNRLTMPRKKRDQLFAHVLYNF